MDITSSIRAVRRARKAFAHSVRQEAEARSDQARRRHARRAMNARRSMREAEQFYAELALIELDD